MTDVEQRLTRHFERATGAPPPGDVIAVMRAGDARRRRRTSLLGVVAVLVVVGAVAAITTMVPGDRHRTITNEPPVSVVDRDALPPAVSGDVPIVWSLVDTSKAGLPSPSCCSGGVMSSGVYSLSTAMGPNGDVVQQLRRTADGVSFVPAADAPADVWIGRLSSSDDQHIYGLATAPGRSPYNFSAVSSSDGGATWQSQQLPIDTEGIATQLGGAGWYAQAVAGGGGHAVVTASPLALTGQGVTGVDAPWGYTVTADGLAVYGAPDLEALRGQLCTAGAVLTQTAPPDVLVSPTTAVGPNGKEVDSTTTNVVVASTVEMPAPASVPVQAGWWCVDPAHPEQSGGVDPAMVHGAVDHVVPFDQLPLSPDTVKAIRRQARVFRMDDGGAWSEVDLPRVVQLDGTGPTALRWFGDHFVLMLSTVDGLAVFTSPDGTTWTEGNGLPALGEAQLVQLPTGAALIVGRRGSQLAAYTSADGGSWTGVALDGLVGDHGQRLLQFQVVAGSAGAAVVAVTQLDPIAAEGGATVSHGDFTLRVPTMDARYELLDRDGVVVAHFDGLPSAPDGGVRLMQRSGDGAILVLDAGGAVLDTFDAKEVEGLFATARARSAADTAKAAAASAQSRAESAAAGTAPADTSPAGTAVQGTAPADTIPADTSADGGSTTTVAEFGGADALPAAYWTLSTVDGVTWQAQRVAELSPYDVQLRPGSNVNGTLTVPFTRYTQDQAKVLVGTPTR